MPSALFLVAAACPLTWPPCENETSVTFRMHPLAWVGLAVLIHSYVGAWDGDA